eukprot:1072800-Prymnesium_polylepis.1
MAAVACVLGSGLGGRHETRDSALAKALRGALDLACEGGCSSGNAHHTELPACVWRRLCEQAA